MTDSGDALSQSKAHGRDRHRNHSSRSVLPNGPPLVDALDFAVDSQGNHSSDSCRSRTRIEQLPLLTSEIAWKISRSHKETGTAPTASSPRHSQAIDRSRVPMKRSSAVPHLRDHGIGHSGLNSMAVICPVLTCRRLQAGPGAPTNRRTDEIDSWEAETDIEFASLRHDGDFRAFTLCPANTEFSRFDANGFRQPRTWAARRSSGTARKANKLICHATGSSSNPNRKLASIGQKRSLPR